MRLNLQLVYTLLFWLVWFGSGYLASGYIIRWNQKHLSGNNIDQRRLMAAIETNADYRLGWGRSISGLKVVMTVFGLMTVTKAVFLRMRGGAL